MYLTKILYVPTICCMYACGMGGVCISYIRNYAKNSGLGLKVHVGHTCGIYLVVCKAILSIYYVVCIILIIHPRYGFVNIKINFFKKCLTTCYLTPIIYKYRLCSTSQQHYNTIKQTRALRTAYANHK